MAEFPITLPYIFGLSFRESSLPVAAGSSAVAGQGITGSLEIGVTVTAGLTLDAVAQTDTSVYADALGGAGWSIRGTPTIEVGLTSAAQLSALADANLDGEATPTGFGGFGIAADVAASVDSFGPQYRGEYDNGADYWPGDIVQYAGFYWMRLLEPNPGYPPGTVYWGDPIASPLSVGVRLDGVSDSELPVTASPDVVFTYNADADRWAIASRPAYLALGSTMGGDLAATFDLPVSGGRGQDIAAELSITAVTESGGFLDLPLDGDLAVTVVADGSTRYGQPLSAQLGVDVVSPAGGYKSLEGDAQLAVSVFASGLLDKTRSGDVFLTAEADTPSAMQANRPAAASVPVTVGTSAQASLESLFEGDLGAVTGLSGAAQRATFAQASTLVSVTITAGLSRGQTVQQTPFGISAATAGDGIRTVLAGAVRPVSVGLPSSGQVGKYSGAVVPVSVSITAAMVSNQVVVADVPVVVTFGARTQLGGTPDERIVGIAAEIRITAAESREGAFVVPAENRLVPIGDTRSMRVEQLN